MEPILEVNGLKKYYGLNEATTKALDGISFTVGKGEFISIMGKSGSGKTTLLNILSTIDTPTEGTVKINNRTLSKLKPSEKAKFRRDSLGFIFQDFKLIDNLTSFENIALSLIIQNSHAPGKIDYLVNEIAEMLAIKKILGKFPYQLSGGQKQRVAVARALITRPPLIIADEPTGALDSENTKNLMEELRRMNKKLKSTILLVTHDEYVAGFSDRIIRLKDGKFEDA